MSIGSSRLERGVTRGGRGEREGGEGGGGVITRGEEEGREGA